MDGLKVENLTKSYPGGVRALDRVSLTVARGLYGLLGRNGADKSTLMRTLATLQRPDSGTISFNGIDALADPDRMRRLLGYLPQHFGAFPGFSARELLERFAWLKGMTDGATRHRLAAELLERIKLLEDADRRVVSFSGGMLRRFGIAIALIGSPRFLIVDEPTAGLNPAERNRFHRVLANLAADAVVLLSTHIVEDIENLCPSLVIMDSGRVVAEGTPKDLIAPLRGRLWDRVIPRGEPEPPGALSLSATPTGTRAVSEAPSAPPEYAPRTPFLEDVYHLMQRETAARAA
ncbi:MAG: ABC transporter ATP-binding protein [Pseudomonadota bacterium]